MMINKIRYNFVPLIPNKIEDGIIYICIEYNVAIHKCACGCGEEVVTPISPDGWSISYNGESISLSPSIGNWSYKCKSHYWIRENMIVWADSWSDERVNKNKKGGKIRKKSFLKRLFKWE